MAANSTTMNNGMKLNNGSTVLLNAINSTDLADAQVRRYIQRLGNVLHMSQDNLKDVVCTDGPHRNDRATLSRESLIWLSRRVSSCGRSTPDLGRMKPQLFRLWK